MSTVSIYSYQRKEVNNQILNVSENVVLYQTAIIVVLKKWQSGSLNRNFKLEISKQKSKCDQESGTNSVREDNNFIKPRERDNFRAAAGERSERARRGLGQIRRVAGRKISRHVAAYCRAILSLPVGGCGGVSSVKRAADTWREVKGICGRSLAAPFCITLGKTRIFLSLGCISKCWT